MAAIWSLYVQVTNRYAFNIHLNSNLNLFLIPLISSRSVYGTDYCDITGETDWVRDMVDKHDPNARASGARIVHFCGHDCVPWDLAGWLNSTHG